MKDEAEEVADSMGPMPSPSPSPFPLPSSGPSKSGDTMEKSDDSNSLPRVRTNFLTTALFIPNLEVDGTGTISVPWVLPSNIANYEIRVYALASDSSFGGGVAEQISRRAVSMQAAG